MLARVVRPDGDAVDFTYDALARRLSKTFRGRITRWIWDGNVPLHEWVERPPRRRIAAPRRPRRRSSSSTSWPPAAVAPSAPPGPPRARPTTCAAPSSRPLQSQWSAGATEPGTAEYPITWLFEPESFAPLAKLVGDDRHAIVTDHLGAPKAMYDAAGDKVWSATIDAYGDLRDVEGTRPACPFRWPGQYEDAETGLYYNRFRYYVLEIGVLPESGSNWPGERPYAMCVSL